MEKQVKVEEQEHNPEEIEPRPIITKRKYTKKSSPSKKLWEILSFIQPSQWWLNKSIKIEH